MNFCMCSWTPEDTTSTYYSIRDNIKSKLLTVCFFMVKVEIKLI